MIREKVKEILIREVNNILNGMTAMQCIEQKEEKLINKYLEVVFNLIEDSYEDMVEFSNNISRINEIFRDAIEGDKDTNEYDEKFCKENVNVMRDYEKYNKKLLNNLLDITREIVDELCAELDSLHLLLYTAKNRKEFDKIYNKIMIMENKVKNNIIDEGTKIFTDLTGQNDELIKEAASIYEIIKEIDKEENLTTKQSVRLSDNTEKIRLNYISSYRDIKKLAEENGYIFNRVGRHHNFINESGKKVPIPYHSKDLGKGISLKIQKEILSII